MAVENDPKWPEWSEAFDAMTKAKDELDAIPKNAPEYKEALMHYKVALFRYNLISANL